ncbi:MAG: sensor histidine kinase [Acidobacteria bacterium]|nr:sensor histidine kinase [Acidobacteriota bacterium]
MKRISTRFALLLAAAAVVPLLGYGAVSLLSLRTGAQQAVIDGNLNVARQVAEQIELYVNGSVNILKAVAADLQQTGLERWQQDRILKNFVLQFTEFKELTLLDENGRPIVSSRLGTPTVAVPGSEGVNLNGTLISRFSVDDDLLPTAVIAVRLVDRGGGGWLVGRLNLEAMWRMVDRIRVGRNGYALVVTNEGQLLAHGNPAAKSLVARGDNLSAHPLVSRIATALPGQQVTFAEYGDERGPMVGVAARLPSLRWTVIVEQPRVEAFAIPIRVQGQLAIAIVVALMVMLGVGYVWGHRFIDPILALTRSTRALAEGRLDERVTVATHDELGQLGVSFNNMADRLVELQEDVRKKERQAMFGRISIGLVHDLSHPIQNIGNSCKLIVKMFDDVEYRENFKRTIERELAQVKRVLDDLRNVARPMPLQRFPIDVNKGLADLVESMQTTADNAGLQIDTEFVLGPLYIEGDLFALNRVYRNLIMNSLQATPPRGRIVVRTSQEHGQAMVQIEDTGYGIPKERLDTIFEDFVTTKRRGLGLGLAISKKIVEQLGGTITVSSEVGVGSTFTLRFPLTEARPSRLAAV